MPIEPANDASIARAADLLRAGQAVALPTETVYGLAKRVSPNAERDADIFIALYNGFIRLVPYKN